MLTIPPNRLTNLHKFGFHRHIYARVWLIALLLRVKRERHPGDGRGHYKLRCDFKNKFCHMAKRKRLFENEKVDISSRDSGLLPPSIWMWNYPQRVPYRWTHCIRSYAQFSRRGWASFCPETLYV